MVTGSTGTFFIPARDARLHVRDLVDHIHSADHLAEDRIASSVIVERAVVDVIDEELASGGVRIVGARHGDRAPDVAQPVARLVPDRCPLARFLFIHLRVEPAALDHETSHHAMEDQVVVEFVVNVLQEVLDGPRSFLRIQFEGDLAHGGIQHHDRVLVVGLGEGRARAQGQARTEAEDHDDDDQAVSHRSSCCHG